MSTPVIQVENLSKAYRIGRKEEVPDTLTKAALGWASAATITVSAMLYFRSHERLFADVA